MKKILVVDDEAEVVQLLKSRLEDIGYKVTCLMEGAHVVSEVKKNRPNLLLLDVILPDLSGYDICAQLKSDRSTKSMPIILLTAKSKIGEIDEGISSGADDYIAKPYDLNELIDRIKKLI